jgi:hypothetical protein
MGSAARLAAVSQAAAKATAVRRRARPDEPARKTASNIDGAEIPGLKKLWAQTRGDPSITIAVVDGPVDRSHPSLRGANVVQVETLLSRAAGAGSAHGTHVASIIFGRHSVRGIAPYCRGLLLPIFEPDGEGDLRPCSQLDLARVITQAVQLGAQVINISGGEFVPGGAAHPILATAIRACSQSGVLMVAAAGNEGCECVNIPAALDSVLAVGAMNARGEPLGLSNSGGPYQVHGILAPGEQVLGANPGGGTVRRSGTSFATAIVSGVAALLLSLQSKRGQRPDPQGVRQALLRSALACDDQSITDCRRLLAGRLNIPGAISFLTQGEHNMVEASELQVSESPGEAGAAVAVAEPPPPPAPAPLVRPSEAASCGCACSASGAGRQLVFVLGQIGYDLISEARLDSLVQKMAGQAGGTTPERVMAFDPRKLLAYLEENPWDAAAVEWTLNVDGAPIYAIRPQGAFAADCYKELRDFLKQRVEEGAERVSIPGVIAGKATLLLGQVVPVIVPDLRGMYSWSTAALVEAVAGPAPPAEASEAEKQAHAGTKAGIENLLQRVYHELRNLGLLPRERALNFAATNAFEAAQVYHGAIREKMELESINVVPSPVSRPGSDCWDVEVYFFYPERQVQTVRKVYRFTVDVSDTVPVTVGTTRSWFTR